MKIGRILCYLFLMTVASAALLSSTSVLAQEETIELKATYPRVESDAPEAIFKFTVTLIYRGDQAREFDLQTSGPPGWSTYVTANDESVRVSVIKLEPNRSDTYQVKVIASPLPSTILEPNDYTITLVASSGAISDSIELTAVVYSRYSLALIPSGRYYSEATVNRDNQFSLTVKNTGNGELTNIRLSSAEKPHEWIAEFKPETIDRLAPGISQEIQVNIKPSAGTAGGYYDVTLSAEADQARQTTTWNIRAEESKDFWRWIGGAIGLLAIGAFTLIFLRFNRNK